MYLSQQNIAYRAPHLVHEGHVFDLHRPRYRIAETLLEKGSGRFNEDELAFNDTTCVVCDGATSLQRAAEQCLPGTSGGQQAARIGAAAFTAANGIDLHESARRANELIRAQMLKAGMELNRREQLWSTSLVAVRIHNHRVDWCQIGDCMILLIFNDGSSRVLTPLPAQDEQVLKNWQAIGADKQGSIHQILAAEIAAVRRQTNRTFGSLNGEDEALDFLVQGSFEDERISDILLFTDGLFPPNPDPAMSFDQDKLVSLYRSAGLGKVRDYIRGVQRDDPRCLRYPRFKMFDDIGAIALRRT